MSWNSNCSLISVSQKISHRVLNPNLPPSAVTSLMLCENVRSQNTCVLFSVLLIYLTRFIKNTILDRIPDSTVRKQKVMLFSSKGEARPRSRNNGNTATLTEWRRYRNNVLPLLPWQINYRRVGEEYHFATKATLPVYAVALNIKAT